ncbi:MAG: class I SAM-dependent methyltransferase family protein [Candidatus Methanomethylicaceae archaeon]|nr:class I SAM-dependent methyltransferase family protein [Candidatus Verstraetearchaeota archaeon]
MKERIVRKALEKIFSKEDLEKAITSIDIIGDIAIIKIPWEWENKKYEIGEAILSSLNGIKGVFRQISPVDPEYRVRGVEWLAGKKETITIHKEHGCLYKLDIAKVYFSPRLSFERLRIAKLVKEGEIIINMFAGIGTFSILIAKKSNPSRIFSIDKNPEAFKYMIENTIINKVYKKVFPILGDAKEVVKEFEGMADRILMPLPDLAIQYLPYAINSLKDYGWIHIYLHQESKNRKNAIVEAEKLLRRIINVKNINGRVVRSVGRKLYQVVLDLEISK